MKANVTNLRKALQVSAVAAHCAANICDWDEKRDIARRMIKRMMRIDEGFRAEIEDCVAEWADENGYSIDFFDGIGAEEIIMQEL